MRADAFPVQPVWQVIDEVVDPEYLFLLGDQIYMDFGWKVFGKEPIGSPEILSEREFHSRMNGKYEKQWVAEKNFNKLICRLRESDGVYGVWDDHDFAWDGAYGVGAGAVPDEKKDASRRLFNKWMYGEESDQEVYRYVDIPGARAIFLDCRFYAEQSGDSASMLGGKQFEFLRSALDHSGEFTIISNGLTMTQLPDLFGIRSPFKKKADRWELFKQEFADFQGLISENHKVLYLAGDIHRNVFAQHKFGTYPTYEIVSSGAAIDHVGLRSIDARRNFGVLDYDEKEIRVQLWSKERPQVWTIDIDSWKVVGTPVLKPTMKDLMNGASRIDSVSD